MIQRKVKNAGTRRVLAGECAEGDTVLVDYTPDGYLFTKQVAETVAA